MRSRCNHDSEDRYTVSKCVHFRALMVAVVEGGVVDSLRASPYVATYSLDQRRRTIEARHVNIILEKRGEVLTLQKFLAGILLEECFVCNGAGEIVDHEVEDRHKLFFGIAGVVS